MFRIQWTPIVKNLVIINVIVFFVLYLMQELAIGGRISPETYLYIRDNFTALYKTNLLGIYGADFVSQFNPIQILSHFFVHFDPMHILFNMLALASLGPSIEMVLGPRRFLRFYLFCGLVGGIILALFDPSENPVVGASGAIFGVMAYFAQYFPNTKLSVFMAPPVSAKKLMIIIVAGSAFLVLLQVLGKHIDFLSGFSGGGISHFGHLSGVIAAGIYYLIERFLPGTHN